MIGLSMQPQIRICFRCRKKWGYDPDIGRISCPYCREQMISSIKSFESIFKLRRDNHGGKKGGGF